MDPAPRALCVFLFLWFSKKCRWVTAPRITAHSHTSHKVHRHYCTLVFSFFLCFWEYSRSLRCKLFRALGVVEWCCNGWMCHEIKCDSRRLIAMVRIAVATLFIEFATIQQCSHKFKSVNNKLKRSIIVSCHHLAIGIYVLACVCARERKPHLCNQSNSINSF